MTEYVWTYADITVEGFGVECPTCGDGLESLSLVLLETWTETHLCPAVSLPVEEQP